MTNPQDSVPRDSARNPEFSTKCTDSLVFLVKQQQRASVFSNQGFSFASRTPEIYPDYPVLYCPLILDHSVSCFHGIARVVP